MRNPDHIYVDGKRVELVSPRLPCPAVDSDDGRPCVLQKHAREVAHKHEEDTN